LAFHSGHEADHLSPSIAEVKEWVELYLHSPNTPSWRGAQLGGAQGQLHFNNFPVQDIDITFMCQTLSSLNIKKEFSILELSYSVIFHLL
jgi:hypothetical protein